MAQLRDDFRDSLDRAATERAEQERRRLARKPATDALSVGAAAAPLAGTAIGAGIGGLLGGGLPGAAAGAGIGGAAGAGVGGLLDLFKGQMGAEDERKQIEEAQRRQSYLQILSQM